MSSLPTEIITDILSRQPAKSLLRFRCVSKPWCSLIDGPHFIKLHLQRSTHAYSHASLILKHYDKLYSLNLDTETVVQLDDPMASPYRDTDLLGSCNGLVCLFNTVNHVALWNPSTRKHHTLPDSSFRFSTSDQIIYGFGYDSTNDDYKVLRIVQRLGTDFDSLKLKDDVVVYSLKLNSWRKIENFPCDLVYSRDSGVFVSGALHYVGMSKYNPDIPVIAAFDLDVETYRLVPRPEIEIVEETSLLQVAVLGGCLCIIFVCRERDVNLWIMKDYGVKESWTKLICISPGVISGYLTHVRPLTYSKNGDALLVEHELVDGVKLVWYDFEKKRLKNAKFHGVPKSFEAMFFAESLVPLKGNSGMGRKKQLEAAEGKKKKNGKKRDDFLSVGFKLAL